LEGPSAALALVLAETAAGGAALLWFGRLWGSVKRGFFILTGSVALGCALLATLAASAAAGPEAALDAQRVVVAAAATAAVLGLSVAALVLRIDTGGRVLGLIAVPLAVAALVALAGAAGPAGTSFPSAMIQLVAGALFMGAVSDGLLLGHWYLVDRRLERAHIVRFATLLIAAVVVEAAAVAILGFAGDGTEPAVGFSPLLSVAGLSTWLSLGMIACTGLIAVLIWASLRGTRARAVQAATGFFYLAVITAFTAEMAAKIGFLG
jgi:hypothetical protein